MTMPSSSRLPRDPTEPGHQLLLPLLPATTVVAVDPLDRYPRLPLPFREEEKARTDTPRRNGSAAAGRCRLPKNKEKSHQETILSSKTKTTPLLQEDRESFCDAWKSRHARPRHSFFKQKKSFLSLHPQGGRGTNEVELRK